MGNNQNTTNQQQKEKNDALNEYIVSLLNLFNSNYHKALQKNILKRISKVEHKKSKDLQTSLVSSVSSSEKLQRPTQRLPKLLHSTEREENEFIKSNVRGWKKALNDPFISKRGGFFLFSHSQAYRVETTVAKGEKCEHFISYHRYSSFR